jgi:hypothetical protein
MKPFLTWLTLGAILFLCSCEESRYQAQAYQPNRITPEMQDLLNTVTPAISYSSEAEIPSKPDFSLSFEEDLQAFHAKVHACAERKSRHRHRLRAVDLCRALVMVEAGADDNTLAVTQPALHTVQVY